jgi:hypothetical protein
LTSSMVDGSTPPASPMSPMAVIPRSGSSGLGGGGTAAGGGGGGGGQTKGGEGAVGSPCLRELWEREGAVTPVDP